MSLYITKHHNMKVHGAQEVYLLSFKTSALDKVNDQLHGQVVLYPREKSCHIHRIEGWVGFEASQDHLKERKISCPC